MTTNVTNMTILFEVADGLVMPAADCTADFDTVCKRIGANPTVKRITYSKKLNKPNKTYRVVGLRLSNGRFATLLRMDSEEFFEIWLQRRGYGYYLSDIDEVREFIRVTEHEVKRLDNGLKWLPAAIA